jgi:hypothetical protein
VTKRGTTGDTKDRALVASRLLRSASSLSDQGHRSSPAPVIVLVLSIVAMIVAFTL